MTRLDWSRGLSMRLIAESNSILTRKIPRLNWYYYKYTCWCALFIGNWRNVSFELRLRFMGRLVVYLWSLRSLMSRLQVGSLIVMNHINRRIYLYECMNSLNRLCKLTCSLPGQLYLFWHRLTKNFPYKVRWIFSYRNNSAVIFLF